MIDSRDDFNTAMKPGSPSRMRTLWLCTVLHGFTHLYQVALLPLYLLIRKDFSLTSDGQATFLVSAMGVAYFLPSYLMGVFADRFSRKKMLATGLFLNALGFILLSFSSSYPLAVCSLLLAGIGGSFFHPPATAWVARLFPEAPGKALGRLGVGASVGFFLGPLYSGWRAEMAGWRQPVLEIGLLGLIGTVLFVLLAHEDRLPATKNAKPTKPHPLFETPVLWGLFLAASFAFCFREFAGSGMASLGSLFLQRARGFSPEATGFALSTIFLASAISNPLFGGLSDQGRIRWTFLVLFLASMSILIFPRVSFGGIVPVLVCYGFFFMASYPMVEAALMQSVPDAVRGRVFGLFITIGGLVGNIAHWAVGEWVRKLGSGASAPENYYGIYNLLSLFVLLSLSGLFFLHRLRLKEFQETPEKLSLAPEVSSS